MTADPDPLATKHDSKKSAEGARGDGDSDSDGNDSNRDSKATQIP